MVIRNVYIKEEEDQLHSKLTEHDVLIPLLATFRSFCFVVDKSRASQSFAETSEQLREHLGAFFAKDDAKEANRLADKLIAHFKQAKGVADKSKFKSEAELNELKTEIVTMLTRWNSGTDYVQRELRKILQIRDLNKFKRITKSAAYHVILEWREVLKEKAISIAKTAWVPSIAPESSDAQVQYCKGTYLCAKPFKRPGDAKFREEAPPYEVLIDPSQKEAQLDDLRKFYEWIETAPWGKKDKERKVNLQLEDEYKPLWSKVFRRWCLPIPTRRHMPERLLRYEGTIADFTSFPKEVKVERIQEALKAYQDFCDPIDFKNDDPETIYVKMHFEGVVRYVAIKPNLSTFLGRNLVRLKEIMNDFQGYLKSVRQYLEASEATKEGLNHLTQTCEEIKTRFAAFATQDEVKDLPWTTFWSEALMRPLRLCEKRHASQKAAAANN